MVNGLISLQVFVNQQILAKKIRSIFQHLHGS